MNVIAIVKRSRILFPLACIAAVVITFVSEGSYRQSVATLDEIGTVAAARMSIQSLERSLLDAETGQRGYLLTSHKEYLQPYERALKKIEESFKILNQHYGEDPKPKDLLRTLYALSETRLAELALTISLHDQGKTVASTEIVLSGIGREHMDSIRTITAELLAYESQRVARGRTHLYRMLMFNRIGVAMSSAIWLFALFMYLRKSFALEQQRLQQQRTIQTERDRLEREVSNRTAQLTELTHHLQTAREDERSRLARDLHDELGALLTSAKLDAARIKSRLGTTAPEALERLAHLVGTLNSGIALKRRIIEDLRPSALSNLGLVSALEILTREFAENSGLEIHCALEPVELEETAELVVYRVVQEALTNIAKYARASHVWVSLTTYDAQVEVSVRDDGIGFDTNTQPSSAHGLVGMRFRVESEGGTLAVVSAPGQSTLIRVTLPESKRDEDPATTNEQGRGY